MDISLNRPIEQTCTLVPESTISTSSSLGMRISSIALSVLFAAGACLCFAAATYDAAFLFPGIALTVMTMLFLTMAFDSGAGGYSTHYVADLEPRVTYRPRPFLGINFWRPRAPIFPRQMSYATPVVHHPRPVPFFARPAPVRHHPLPVPVPVQHHPVQTGLRAPIRYK